MEGVVDDVKDKDNKTEVSHPFSKPWDDSDVILEVEEQEFHVHKIILKMASPIFKAMFDSEKGKTRFPLPGKKFNEFLDLMKQIYPISNDNNIERKNISHLSSLANEFQIKSVVSRCLNFLKTAEKTKENAIEVLVCTDRHFKRDYEEVSKGCFKVIRNMTMDEMGRHPDFREMTETALGSILKERVQGLETYILDSQKLVEAELCKECDIYFGGTRVKNARKSYSFISKKCTRKDNNFYFYQ